MDRGRLKCEKPWIGYETKHIYATMDYPSFAFNDFYYLSVSTAIIFESN